VSDPPPIDGLAADLFERHGRLVRAYLRALTGSIDLAEDLAQDVFVRVVRGAVRYEARERERAWLFRIARNALTDHRRRLAVRSVVAHEASEPTVEANQLMRLELHQALARLPDIQREAFLMAEIGGLSYFEIADVLEMSVAAIRSALYRARLSLRADLLPLAPLQPPTKRTAP
jgi:RNA polymerase sigma-70 factor, ECF subfamily